MTKFHGAFSAIKMAMISVVIPTLNAARTLPAALAALAPGLDSGLIKEVLISDGGSTDGTPELARTLDTEVLTGPRGRGGQLQRGAIAARGEWLFFLHCDTVLDPEWLFAAEEFVANRDNGRRAAAFRFALDDDHPRARRLERMVAWKVNFLPPRASTSATLQNKQTAINTVPSTIWTAGMTFAARHAPIASSLLLYARC
mgnify:CR=1 FL=1